MLIVFVGGINVSTTTSSWINLFQSISMIAFEFFCWTSISFSDRNIILARNFYFMVSIENNTITITMECDNAPESLHQLRSALTVMTAILVESDEFYNFTDLPGALSTLIKFHGELYTENGK